MHSGRGKPRSPARQAGPSEIRDYTLLYRRRIPHTFFNRPLGPLVSETGRQKGATASRSRPWQTASGDIGPGVSNLKQ